MKKSDELFRQALSAKSDETTMAKARIAKMLKHSEDNKEALQKALASALKFLSDQHSVRINDLQKQITQANSDFDEHTRQLNSMFSQLIDQEDVRLADYSQFDNEVSGFETKGKSNSQEIPKLKSEDKKP